MNTNHNLKEQKIFLYENRKTIHNRSVTGWFNNMRNLLFILIAGGYFLIPWIKWEGKQAILFNLSNREFNFFNVNFLPQDVLYLALLLMISAYALFLFTAVAGRLFCGYACPQTVFANIYMKIEKWIEGDYVARKRLDEMPINFYKFRVRAIKYFIWLTFALFIGFTFISYFDPLTSVINDILHFSLSGWQTFFLFLSAFMSLLFAGYMREQVCKYMCPYARFQSVMFDKDTMIVSYDGVIGEPRGKRKKDADIKSLGLGYCTDCGVCVDVCPTGIDIRKGLQYECIGCGACIDGCNEIMKKINYPIGLVRYTSENGINNRFNKSSLLKRIIRPRILIYTLILIALIALLTTLLINRNPVKTAIIQDRASISRVLDNINMIEGVYQLRVSNSANKAHKLSISVSGIEGIKLDNIKLPIVLAPESSETYIFSVRVPMESVNYATSKSDFDKNYNIQFQINSVNSDEIRESKSSTFMVRYRSNR